MKLLQAISELLSGDRLANRSSRADTGEKANDGAVNRRRLLRLIALLLPIVAIAGVVNYLMREPPEVNQAPPRDQEIVAAEAMEMTDIVSNMFASLESTLGTITDVASAEAALPSLRRSAATAESIANLVKGLPDIEQSAVVDQIGSSHTSLMPLVESLMGKPEIAEIIKPTIDDVLARLQDSVPTVQ